MPFHSVARAYDSHRTAFESCVSSWHRRRPEIATVCAAAASRPSSGVTYLPPNRRSHGDAEHQELS